MKQSRMLFVARPSSSVIPGRVKRAPGIHFSVHSCGTMDSGLTLRAPRNDGGKTHPHLSATEIRPDFADTSSLDHWRAQGMPGARCARSLACKIKKHTS
jgi:hypothetical protein